MAYAGRLHLCGGAAVCPSHSAAWGVTFSVWGSFNAPSYVGPEAMWAPLAFAAAVVSFVFYGIRMSAEKGGHLSLCDLAAVVLTFASATVVLVLWYQGGGALFIQYIGENHSIHLTSANAKDFASLILQDHVPSRHFGWRQECEKI